MKKVIGIDAGFTFVETLAVLAVTAILASQAGVAAHALMHRARVAGAKTQIEQFKIALQSYYVDCGRFPTDEQGLAALWQKPVLVSVCDGGKRDFACGNARRLTVCNRFVWRRLRGRG